MNFFKFVFGLNVEVQRLFTQVLVVRFSMCIPWGLGQNFPQVDATVKQIQFIFYRTTVTLLLLQGDFL